MGADIDPKDESSASEEGTWSLVPMVEFSSGGNSPFCLLDLIPRSNC